MFRGKSVTEKHCVERYDVGDDIRQQMEGIGHDGDGVGQGTTNDLNRHEDQGYDGDFLELGDDYFIGLVHCRFYNKCYV